MSESDPEGDGLKLEERLKICTNSKVLDKKIRDSFKKNQISQEKSKSSKKKGPNERQGEKNGKVKTQPVEEDREDDSEDIKIL